MTQRNPKLSIPGTGRPDPLEPMQLNHTDHILDCSRQGYKWLNAYDFIHLNLILHSIQYTSGVNHGFK